MSQSKMSPQKSPITEQTKIDSTQGNPDQEPEPSDTIILWISTLTIWISLAISLANIKSESTVLWLLGAALLAVGILTNFLKSKRKKSWTFIAISITAVLITTITYPGFQ